MTPRTARRRPRRRGFSAVEVLITVVIGGLVLTGLWLVLRTSQRAQTHGRASSDLVLNGLAVNAALRTALEGAGAGLPRAWNVGSVQVAVGAGPDAVEADTLTILRGTGGPTPVTALPCVPAASTCVRLLGMPRALVPGTLWLAGHAELGARVVQVTAVGAPEIVPCGAACGAAPDTVQCADSTVGTWTSVVVTSARYTPPSDTAHVVAGPCPASSFPDGTRCDEITAVQPIGTTHALSCSGGPVRPATVVSVTFVDRTAVPLGFPPPPVQATTSGAGGAPEITWTPLALERFWVDYTTDAAHPRLVRQVGLTADGTWTTPLPVAADIQRFRVETQWPADTALHRGLPFTAADLRPVEDNPNWMGSAVPVAGLVVRGVAFRLSYRDLASVRVRFAAATRDMDPRSATPRPFVLPLATWVALPATPWGGSAPLSP